MSAEPVPVPAPHRRLGLAVALALVVAVLAVYAPVRAHGWVGYDDDVYLGENPHVARGLDWGEIGWVFTHDHAANYHPLTWISHMLDVELFGLERPGAHHVMNVGLHALNALLVLLLARALLGGLWAPALAAALFALHPLRVESVAWASERKDVLCALFFLGTCLAYLAYGARRSAGRYALVLALCALALLAKPMAVTLPCVLLTFDAWPLARLRAPFARSARRLLLEKLPLFAFVVAFCTATFVAQRAGEATGDADAFPLGLRLVNALASVGIYVGQSLWPTRLSAFYPHAGTVEAAPLRALLGPALAAAGLLAVGSWLAWRRRRAWPWLALGWVWMLGTLVPVLGFVQVGSQAHADRYTYLPMIGLSWIAAGVAAELVCARAALRPWVAGTCAAVVLTLAVAARRQVAVWRDTPALFEHALALDARNYIAHVGLGAHALAEEDRPGAEQHFLEAVRIHPLEITAHVGLARLYLDAGQLDAAESHLRFARRVHPTKWVHYQAGRLALMRGQFAPAVEEFEAALALDPSLVDAYVNLGNALRALGRRADARARFEQGLALVPELSGAYNGLGALALDDGDAPEAERLFARAVELDPDYADAHNNLGVALERQGRMAEARASYAEAQRLRGPR